jgi:hypothetical protein
MWWASRYSIQLYLFFSTIFFVHLIWRRNCWYVANDNGGLIILGCLYIAFLMTNSFRIKKYRSMIRFSAVLIFFIPCFFGLLAIYYDLSNAWRSFLSGEVCLPDDSIENLIAINSENKIRVLWSLSLFSVTFMLGVSSVFANLAYGLVEELKK